MNGHRREKNVHVFLIVCAGLLIYSNTFRAPFLFDDRINIVTNAALQDVGNFLDPSKLMDMSAHSTNLKYAIMTRILGYFTFALNYTVNGLDVVGYHIVNIAVHLANALLVYFLVLITFETPYLKSQRGESRPPGEENDYRLLAALGAALIFVCHPLQTQAVTYISQRFASLATFFYLAALLVYIKSRTAGSASLCFYGLAVTLSICAVLTKEISSTLFLTMILYEVMFFEGEPLKRLYRIIPFFLVSFIIPAVLLYVQKTVNTVSTLNQSMAVLGGEQVLPRWHYFLTQMSVIVTYLRLLAFPLNQNFDYAYPVHRTFLDPVVLLSASFLLALLIAAVSLYVRSRDNTSPDSVELRFISFGIIWFFCTLSVESSVIPIADVINEHRVYLPSVGFIIAFVFLLFILQRKLAIISRVKIVIPILIVSVLALGGAAFARNRVWQDPVRFWEDAARKSPGKARPHTQLSIAYGRAGKIEESIVEYQKAMQLNPDFMKSHAALGVQQQEFEQVLREARISSALAHDKKGVTFLDRGDFDEAIKEFNASIGILPDYIDAHAHLGFAYAKTKRFEDAVRECKTAVAVQPERADLHYNLGVVYYLSDRVNEADKEFKYALRLDPGDAGSREMLERIKRGGKSSRP